jgi:hypothetical protein
MTVRSLPDADVAVQGLWIGSSLGPLQTLCIRSFLDHGHEFRLFTYGDVSGVPAGTTRCDASEILPEGEIFRSPEGFGAGSYAAFSDLFRYQLLFDRGGWWVDTDVFCLKPFTFGREHVFAAEVSRKGQPTTATCVIRSPARSDYLGYCLDVCAATRRDTLQWGQIGPDLLDDAIARFSLKPFRTPTSCFNPVNYYDTRECVAPEFDVARLRESFGVHLWNQMWTSLGLDASADMPPDSLIRVLAARLKS